jgi:hypothetical protein
MIVWEIVIRFKHIISRIGLGRKVIELQKSRYVHVMTSSARNVKVSRWNKIGCMRRDEVLGRLGYRMEP